MKTMCNLVIVLVALCSLDLASAKLIVRTIQEVRIENGQAGASSEQSDALSAARGFQRHYLYGWQNKFSYGDLPEMIWYNFRHAFVPAEISFQPRSDSANHLKNAPSKYQFVGTNDKICNQYSEWTVLCEDLSGEKFTRLYQPKYCVVGENITVTYRCLGIRILRTATTRDVSLSTIRMWRKTDFRVDGGFTEWTKFSDCSVSCGEGTRQRTRSCTNPTPQHGGANCVGATVDTQECEKAACPIDGGFTSWSGYTDCTVTCGEGTKKRTRTCTNPTPQHGGADCVGATVDTEKCDAGSCPVDGGWSAYGNFGECTKTCGGGIKTKSRTCNNPPPSNGGQQCIGFPTKTEICNTDRCKVYTIYAENDICQDGGYMELSCGNSYQVIRLDGDYFYGRKEKDSCPAGQGESDANWDVQCKGGRNEIFNECQDKNSCTIYANNESMGGDPCPGTPKYLYVKFRCYG